MHPGTRNKLREAGIPTEHRRATQMTARDGKDYDYLIGMDRWNLRNMKGILREEDWGKVSMLLHFCGEDREVADPWYTGDFDQTYEDVTRGCAALLETICREGRLEKNHK